MKQQQKFPMNFLLVLSLAATAAFAAPIQEEEVLQVAATPTHTNRDSRNKNVSESKENGLPESRPSEITIQLHRSNTSQTVQNEHKNKDTAATSDNQGSERNKFKVTIQILSDDSGFFKEGDVFEFDPSEDSSKHRDWGLLTPIIHNFTNSGSTGTSENKHRTSRELGGKFESNTSSGISDGSNDSDSLISMTESVSGHGHGGDSIIKADGSQQSSDSKNSEESHNNEAAAIISTLHEGDSVIKGSINDSFQASGESSIVGGGNERHSTDKEVGSEHTETKKSTDEQGYGLNHGSSLGTGDANSGTTVTSQTVQSEHQGKDSAASSDNQGSERRKIKIIVLSDNSGFFKEGDVFEFDPSEDSDGSNDSDSLISMTESVSGHGHGGDSIIKADGSQQSSDTKNTEESHNHDAAIISTLHEGDSGIKGSINDSFQASGESKIVGGGNERHSAEKFSTSSASQKEEGNEHTETKKSTDEQGYGANHGSSLGTGDGNSGTTVTSQTVQNEHQGKDTTASSNNQGSERRKIKITVLSDNSGFFQEGAVLAFDPSEDSSKHGVWSLSNPILQNFTNSGSTVTSENKQRTSRKLGGKFESNTSSGITDGSNDSVDQSGDRETNQENNSNKYGIKEDTEITPVKHVYEASNEGKTKGLDTVFESDLNSKNILQGSTELNVGTISTESSEIIVPEDTAVNGSEAQSGDNHLPVGLSIEKDIKKLDITLEAGHKETEYDDGSSRKIQTQHEIPASSNGKFTLPNSDRITVHVLGKNLHDTDIGARNNGIGSNRIHYHGLLATGNIHRKVSDHDVKGSNGGSVSECVKCSGDCSDSTGGVDTQNKQSGFAWLDDDSDVKADGTSGGESRNIAVGKTEPKLESSVDGGNESRTVEIENHEHTVENEQVESGGSDTVGNTKNNKDEQTEQTLSNESSEKKHVETSINISTPTEDLGKGHGEAAQLEVSTEGESGSTVKDSRVSEEKHDASLKNEQGRSVELLTQPEITSHDV